MSMTDCTQSPPFTSQLRCLKATMADRTPYMMDDNNPFGLVSPNKLATGQGAHKTGRQHSNAMAKGSYNRRAAP